MLSHHVDSAVPTPRVYVVEDDPTLLRATLAMLAGVSSVRLSGFPSAEAFLAGFDGTAPGVLVLDYLLPGLSGEELLERFFPAPCDVPVVMLSAAATVPLAVRLVKRGVRDVLEKPASAARLVELVTQLVGEEREAWPLRAARRQFLTALGTLSPREREVMDELLRGGANKDVAVALNISPRTVEIHRGRVLQKMGAASVVELMRRREELGLRI